MRPDPVAHRLAVAAAPARARELVPERPNTPRPPVQPLVPTLVGLALHGWFGDAVGTIAPQSEAHPAALLATLLAAFGNAVGSGPHARVGGAIHPARINVLIVGQTAHGRKGQSNALAGQKEVGLFSSRDGRGQDEIQEKFGQGPDAAGRSGRAERINVAPWRPARAMVPFPPSNPNTQRQVGDECTPGLLSPR